jgi:hypothetical protein
MKLNLFLLAAGMFAAVSVRAQLPASKTTQDAVVSKITGNQWSGAFLIVSGTLTNTNTFAIKIVHLGVEGYSASDAKSYSTEDSYSFNEDLTPGQIGSFRLQIKDATKKVRFVKVTPTVEITIDGPVAVAPPPPSLLANPRREPVFKMLGATLVQIESHFTGWSEKKSSLGSPSQPEYRFEHDVSVLCSFNAGKCVGVWVGDLPGLTGPGIPKSRFEQLLLEIGTDDSNPLLVVSRDENGIREFHIGTLSD